MRSLQVESVTIKQPLRNQGGNLPVSSLPIDKSKEILRPPSVTVTIEPDVSQMSNSLDSILFRPLHYT